MAAVGDRIETGTGEYAVVLALPEDARTGALEVEHFEPPHAGFLDEHFHTKQAEAFEVVSGRARYRLNGADGDLSAGERLEVPIGAHHVNPWNDSGEDLMLRVRTTPALDFVLFFEVGFGWAREGRLKGGKLSPVQAATLLGGLQSKTYLAGRPIGAQDAAFAVLGLIGRLGGLRVRPRRA